MSQRERNAAFADAEVAAERTADGTRDDALFAQVLKGNVGAAALWSKLRRGWSDISRVEVVKQLRSEERAALFRALDAAGLEDEQLVAFQAAYEEEDAGTVH